MHPFKGSGGIALAIAFGLAAPFAQGSLITPDSIPNPPQAVGSADGTPVPAANLVTSQYAGLGLSFSSAAITRINGATVWAPVQMYAVPAGQIAGQPPPIAPPPAIGYEPWSGGFFVLPGTSKPASISSMTLEIVGASVGVDIWNSQWQGLGTVGPGPNGIGPHGGRLYTFSGRDISSFDVFVPIIDGLPPADIHYPAWGIAQVSFTTNPEPSALVLAALGALGLAGRFFAQRRL